MCTGYCAVVLLYEARNVRVYTWYTTQGFGVFLDVFRGFPWFAVVFADFGAAFVNRLPSPARSLARSLARLLGQSPRRRPIGNLLTVARMLIFCAGQRRASATDGVVPAPLV